jgi:hypothetical protein
LGKTAVKNTMVSALGRLVHSLSGEQTDMKNLPVFSSQETALQVKVEPPSPILVRVAYTQALSGC